MKNNFSQIQEILHTQEKKKEVFIFYIKKQYLEKLMGKIIFYITKTMNYFKK